MIRGIGAPVPILHATDPVGAGRREPGTVGSVDDLDSRAGVGAGGERPIPGAAAAAPAASPGATVELATTGVAVGGDAVAREPGGRVVFVRGALPEERVLARITEARRRFARGEVLEVLDPSPDRVPPPCPHVADGCGGCSWQHVTPEAQRRLKEGIVADTLRRVGHVEGVPVSSVALPDRGYRTSLRCLVVGGGLAFRRFHGHDAVPVRSCLVAHPLLDELFREGRFDGAEEVELRAGARTGERLVVAHPTATDLVLPPDVLTVGTDELEAGAAAWYHEEAGGRRWRVSALSFFQVRPDGADVLAGLVAGAAGDATTAVDLYSGVGLFAGVLAERELEVVAVEGRAGAAADARHNLAGLPVNLVEGDVLAWSPTPADLVVADPSRAGLGERGVEVIAACDPRRVVVVACDPAALGRDAGLLVARGFGLSEVTVVDLFPHTPHVEAVAVFDRP